MPNKIFSNRPFPRFGRHLSAIAVAAVVTLGTAACGVRTADGSTSDATSTSPAGQVVAGSLFDSSAVHDVEISADDADVEAAISTYLEDDDKTWISATVTIDGQVFEDVGLRLKGNSSLRTISTDDAQTPQELPWLVRLDKFVDDQSLDGVTSFVIRSNTSATAMNEAVALELIGLSGLATEEAIATRVSFNDGEESLRLVIENPDDAWAASEFSTLGTLYKAESTGDYTYRGEDPASYDEVFDLEAGEEDYAPLTAFLQFINEADDATFGAELGEHLDVDAFATYLAVQDLVANNDDIDGPGNNSYLHHDPQTGLMTVVAWDQNLSFGVENVGGGAPGAAQPNTPGGDAGDAVPARPGMDGDGEVPTAGEAPAGRPAPTDQEARPGQDARAGQERGGGDGASGGNVLAQRFLADDAFNTLYTERLAELTDLFYTDGVAAEVVATWSTVLSEQATDLVSQDTIQAEAANIETYFD